MQPNERSTGRIAPMRPSGASFPVTPPPANAPAMRASRDRRAYPAYVAVQPEDRIEPSRASGRESSCARRSPGGSAGRRAIARCAALALGLALLAACGDNGSTQPGSPPAALVQLSVPVDTVDTGEQTDPPLSVRVEDALGNPVEGTPVRFVVSRGEGRMFPGVAVSGVDGIAESSYQAGGTPGEASIRADVPSAPNVAALEFRVLALAADSVALSVADGDGQRAEAGSQLALPFEVEVHTPGGAPAGGVSVAWRIVEGREASAVLTVDSMLTAGDGRARTVLTLGRTAGEYAVEAFAARGVLSDTVRFSATATAGFEGSVRLDSVASGALATAEQATLHGQGFSPIPAENDVRVEGARAQVIAATGSELTIQVPDFSGECLPERAVGVRVLVQGDASNGRMIPLRPSQSQLELEVGQAVTLRGIDEVACLQFGETASPREYRLAIGSTARESDQRVAMRISTRAPSELDAGAIAGAIAPPQLTAGVQEAVRERARAEVQLRQRTLQGLRRSRVGAAVPRPRANVTAVAPPTAGDTLEHFFATQTSFIATCADTATRVRAVVRGVGRHLVLAEDVSAPAGGFTAEDWTAVLAELDQVVAPLDTAYFGPYDDIDGNDRVTVLFTPRVNQLSTGTTSGIGGFFLPLDLAASGRGGGGLPGPAGEVCPASNEAEILYMVVADPEGEAGPTVSRARAMRNALGLVAHELQHLISAERRILHGEGGFSASEEVWLDEGLSSLAEEVAGLAVIQRAVGGNYTFDQVANSRAELDAFNSYQINNFFNLSLYMLDPANAPTISSVDPGGAEGLQMRGFAWFFLRWLADGGSNERILIRDLVGGGPNTVRGIENIERVTGRRWEDLLSEFSVAVATDDAGIDALADRFRVTTWHFRDVFGALNRNPAAGSLFPLSFPLQASVLEFETGAADFDVGASTVRYFALVSGIDAPALSMALSTPGGAGLSETAEPQITIVRTR